MLQKSPFKFLDSFTKDDRDIFFGRDKEIEELHSRVFESKILLVYGTSGTGKSSLINCGLANRFSDSDWLPVNIRRGTDINYSLFEALSRNAITKAPFEKAGAAGSAKYNLEKLLRSVYLDHFRPVFLIFDQFEELFIFGRKEEKNELIKNVAKVLDSDIQCRFIFAMREEYLAGVTEFERVIPSFLSNRLRIEKMTRQNAIQTIEGPCRVNNIEVEAGFAESLLEKLNPDTPEVELTWLQIFLDKIMKLAEDEDHSVRKIPLELLSRLGDVKDILGSFLEEQISQLSDPETGLVVLKSFVSAKGTKRHISQQEVIEYSGTFGKEIDGETIKELIQRFIKLRILRDKDEDGKYELRHDSLASKIYEKITIVEKELLEIKNFIDNAFVNYEKRGLLLSDEDLKYIAPYEDKLFLNEKIQSFIDRSKQAFQRARRRRQTIAIAAASIIIIVLSFFTIWAMRERKNAIVMGQMAIDQKDEAVRSKVEADSAKQVALISQKRAEENENTALEARSQSDIARKEALFQQQIALQQRNRAEQMSVLANEQAMKAEEEKVAANQQRIIAEAAEEKAKRLSLLSTAQNLALRSLTLDDRNAHDYKAQLAVHAYKLHSLNAGLEDDPVIWKALIEALLPGNSTYNFPNVRNKEFISIARQEDGFVAADLDGFVFKYNSGEETSEFNKEIPGNPVIEFLSLSPDGMMVLAYLESGKLFIYNCLSSECQELTGTEMPGHSGRIRAACWDPKSGLLATGGMDSLIKVWEINPQPIVIKTIKTHSAIRSLTFCGTDSLASSHDDSAIILWNLKDSTDELIYGDSNNFLAMSLAWNKNKKILLAGSLSGLILLFDFQKYQCEFGPDKFCYYGPKGFNAHASAIDHMIFNDDFSLLATSGWDKTIKVYNYEEFFEKQNSVGGVRTIDGIDFRARAIIFTNNRQLVASTSDNRIRKWLLTSEEIANILCEDIFHRMDEEEWKRFVGPEIPFEETCDINP